MNLEILIFVYFVSRVNIKLNENCLLVLSLANRYRKKKETCLVMKPEENRKSLQKGWMSISEKGCCVALGFQRETRPIQYELNQILSPSKNWLPHRRFFISTLSTTHFCNSADQHIINIKSYEVVLNLGINIMHKNFIWGRWGSIVC